jgi:hypothetical protein
MLVMIFLTGEAQMKEMPALTMELSFHCLWWSESQMEGLNPNAPPPKKTDVKIEKWEYSDPIGVPHPDVVDLVIDLRNAGGVAAEKLRVQISAAWLIGPQSNRKRALWKAGETQKISPVDLAANENTSLRIPVNIAQKMKTLQRNRQWPWTLRMQISVFSASGRLVSKSKADLPIFPGD